jgi:hypothetical protein
MLLAEKQLISAQRNKLENSVSSIFKSLNCSFFIHHKRKTTLFFFQCHTAIADLSISVPAQNFQIFEDKICFSCLSNFEQN